MKKLLFLIFLSISSLIANDFINDIRLNYVQKKIPSTLNETPQEEVAYLPSVTLEVAIKEYELKNYEKAGDMFIALLMEGNSSAYSYLAEIFGEGKGVPINCKKGVFFAFTGLKKADCRSNLVLSNWIKNATCLSKPNMKKSFKYKKFYDYCEQPHN